MMRLEDRSCLYGRLIDLTSRSAFSSVLISNKYFDQCVYVETLFFSECKMLNPIALKSLNVDDCHAMVKQRGRARSPKRCKVDEGQHLHEISNCRALSLKNNSLCN